MVLVVFHLERPISLPPRWHGITAQNGVSPQNFLLIFSYGRNTKKEQIQEFHKGEQDITDSGETPGIKNDSTNSGNKPGSSTEEEDGFPKKEMDNDGDSKVAPTTVKAQLDYLLQMPAILEKSEMVEEDVTAELPETTTEGCFEPASATGTKLWSTCISNEVVDA